MCCTMYQYSQVYHKSVNGWNCIYIQAAATAATAATLSSSLKEICHTIFPLFINSSQREHSHPSTNYFHILPRFPSALRSRELIERKKKKKQMLKRLLCLLTPSPDLPPTHPPTPSLPSFKLLTLQRLFLLSRKTTMVVSSFFVIFLLASVLFFVSRLCLCGCYSYGHHPSFLRFVFFFLFLFVWF